MVTHNNFIACCSNQFQNLFNFPKSPNYTTTSPKIYKLVSIVCKLSVLKSPNSSKILLTSIKISQLYDGSLGFIYKIVKNCAGSSELCLKIVENYCYCLLVRICAENDSKCEYVQNTGKSAIPHPPHLNCTSAIPSSCAKEPNQISLIKIMMSHFRSLKMSRCIPNTWAMCYDFYFVVKMCYKTFV